MNKLVAGLLVSCLCVASAAPSAMATAYTWNHAAGGSWQGSANWLPNTGPPVNGTVEYCSFEFRTVSMAGAGADKRLSIVTDESYGRRLATSVCFR
jgi:hypothetical protein